MSKDQLLKEIRSLPEEERWELLGEALETASPTNGTDAHMTPEFRAELERRMEDMEAHPQDEMTVEEALAEVDRHLKSL